MRGTGAPPVVEEAELVSDVSAARLVGGVPASSSELHEPIARAQVAIRHMIFRRRLDARRFEWESCELVSIGDSLFLGVTTAADRAESPPRSDRRPQSSASSKGNHEGPSKGPSHLRSWPSILVEVMGLEPTASSMRPKRSSQLSYTPAGTVTLARGHLGAESATREVSCRSGAWPAAAGPGGGRPLGGAGAP